MEIIYYYDPQNTEEKEIFDDLLTYSRDICSRTVLSLVIDKVSEQKFNNILLTSLVIY